MEHLIDMYYLIRFIVDRIFVYLRDFILHELSWFPEDNDDLDVTETKPRTHPFTRRAVADFVAFATICAIFGSFVILSTKCNKEQENNYETSQRPITPESEGEPLELLDDDECTISGTPPEESRGNVWGDALRNESVEPVTKLSRAKLLPRPKMIHTCKRGVPRWPTLSELRATNSQHSQSTQTNERIIQRVTSKRDWLIRRTRSGHIYGKYPL